MMVKNKMKVIVKEMLKLINKVMKKIVELIQMNVIVKAKLKLILINRNQTIIKSIQGEEIHSHQDLRTKNEIIRRMQM